AATPCTRCTPRPARPRSRPRNVARAAREARRLSPQVMRRPTAKAVELADGVWGHRRSAARGAREHRTGSQDQMRRFVRDSASVLATQVGVTALGVATSVITARMLGPHDRGLFQLLVLLPTTLANFVKLGIPQANVYFMRRENASAPDVAANSIWLALVLGGGLAVAAYVCRDWMLAPFLREAPPATVLAVLALVPCVLLQTFFSGVLQAEQRFREFNIQQLLPAVLALLGMPVALVWLRMGLVGAIVTQTVIAIVVTVWLAARGHRAAHFGLGWDAPPPRGVLAFCGESDPQRRPAPRPFSGRP